MITIRNYIKAESLEQAFELNKKASNRIIGGMLWMKLGSYGIDTAIDLSGLGLDNIDETETEFSIGAMTTLRQLEQHEALNAYSMNSVRNAVRDIIGVQFRNLATIGGSIWGRFGFSDVLTVFLAMDSYVELYCGPEAGFKLISLEEFGSLKPDNSILTRLIVRKTTGRFVYSAMRNQRTDFPITTCAVSEMNGVYRAAIGARPAKAALVYDEEGLLAGGITRERAEAFAAFAAAKLPTGSNIKGSAEYRTHLIKVLTRRNICEMAGI